MGMTFDFSKKGKVIVNMSEYMTNMVEEFPMDFKPTDIAPRICLLRVTVPSSARTRLSSFTPS